MKQRFGPVLNLMAGDMASRAVSLAAFLYISRVAGAEAFGMIEFAVAALAYFLLLGDCGLETWSVRAVATGTAAPVIAGRVLPLRLGLSAGAYLLMTASTRLMPPYPGLTPAVAILGFSLFAQALQLKWVLMGQERMRQAAAGLLLAQVVFALAAVALLRGPEQILWIAGGRVAADTVSAGYSWILYMREFGGVRFELPCREWLETLQSAAAIGAVQVIGLLSYNFDAILLGFLGGAVQVGHYSAAYKPVTIALAIPLSSFSALLPGLSRAHQAGGRALASLVERSVELTTAAVVPIGVLGWMLSGPVIELLYGPGYADAAPVFHLLCWSAVLVTVRSNFKHGLTAAGLFRLDLLTASAAITVNIVLNVLFIPRWGAWGAATATLCSDLVWLSLAGYWFFRKAARIRLVAALAAPAAGGLAMAAAISGTRLLPPVARAAAGLAAYAAVVGPLLLRSEAARRTAAAEIV